MDFRYLVYRKERKPKMKKPKVDLLAGFQSVLDAELYAAAENTKAGILYSDKIEVTYQVVPAQKRMNRVEEFVEKIREIQGILEENTQIEEEAIKLICQGKMDEAIELLNTENE